MPPGKKLSEIEGNIILALPHEQNSKQKIADAVCWSKRAAQDVLNNSNESKRKYLRTKNHKPMNVTKDWSILKALNDEFSANDLRCEMKLTFTNRHFQQKHHTVCHLKYKRMMKGPYINPSYKIWQMEFPTIYLQSEANEPKNVNSKYEKGLMWMEWMKTACIDTI